MAHYVFDTLKEANYYANGFPIYDQIKTEDGSLNNFNSHYCPTINTKVEFNCLVPQEQSTNWGNSFFGVLDENDRYNENKMFYLTFGYGSRFGNKTFNPSGITFDVDLKLSLDKNGFYVNDVLKNQLENVTFENPNTPINLGNYYSNHWQSFKGIWKSFKIYENNSLARNFLPTKVESKFAFVDVITKKVAEGMLDEQTNIFEGELLYIDKPSANDTCLVKENNYVYTYKNNAWNFWYIYATPLVFKGITFEQTDYWQRPEFVFRGFSFEELTKAGGMSPLFLAEP